MRSCQTIDVLTSSHQLEAFTIAKALTADATSAVGAMEDQRRPDFTAGIERTGKRVEEFS